MEEFETSSVFSAIKMTERSLPSDPLSDPIVAAAIEAKDRIIHRQAERIDELETEIRRLHEERQRLDATIKSLLHNEQQKQRLATTRSGEDLVIFLIKVAFM